MAKLKHRIPNSCPETEYGEIYIPNDQNLGEGIFTTVLKPNALSTNKAISSIVINKPVFQISVNINPGTKEVPVLLGRADGSNPISKKTFILPSDIDSSKPHTLVATFKNWQITSLKLDGVALIEK